MIISSDDLVRRNAAFAATGAFAGLPFPTNDTLQVLGCVDSRVDPSDVLGLELGEGVVMRNIGGRITPATLRSWALLGRLGQGQPLRSGHLVILHHTDCGILRLTDYPEQLAAFFEIPADELESKAVADPYAAVRVDTAIARRTLPARPRPAWSTTSTPGSSRSSTRPPRSSSRCLDQLAGHTRDRRGETGPQADGHPGSASTTPSPRRPHDIIAPPGGRHGHRTLRPRPEATAKWLAGSVRHDPADTVAAAFGQAEARDPARRRTWVVLVDGAEHQLGLIHAEADCRGTPSTS